MIMRKILRIQIKKYFKNTFYLRFLFQANEMVPSLLPKRKSSAPDLDLDSKKSKLGENFDPVVLENISASMIGQEQNNGIFA